MHTEATGPRRRPPDEARRPFVLVAETCAGMAREVSEDVYHRLQDEAIRVDEPEAVDVPAAVERFTRKGPAASGLPRATEEPAARHLPVEPLMQ